MHQLTCTLTRRTKGLLSNGAEAWVKAMIHTKLTVAVHFVFYP